MIERAVVEYIANALWQIPLLAGGAWLLLRMARPGVRVQHGVWLGVLALAVLLPLRGLSLGNDVVQTQREVVAPQMQQPLLRVVGAFYESPAAGGWKSVARDWVTASARLYRVHLPAEAVDWVVGVYAASVMFGVFRIVRAWRVARGLVEGSRETALACDGSVRFFVGYARRFGCRLPELRASDEVRSPMIVGAVRPVLLLPGGFGRHTEDEVRAVLAHELAHVRRWDYVVNLVCQVVALPVVWHPVTHRVQGRIRRTREMVCDAMAAEEMESEIGYARCLLTMARGMTGERRPVEQAGVGLFGNNVLEERMMRLMETKRAMSVRAKAARVVSGGSAMVAAAAVAAMFHVVPTRAASDAAVMPAGMQSVQAVQAAQPAQPIASGVADPEAAAVQESQKPVAEAKKATAGRERESFAIVDGHRRGLTPEEKVRVDRAMADAKQKIDEATARINSPEFKKQMEEARKQAAAVDTPEFRKQIADAQKQAALFDSPEFKKRMEDVQKQVADATARVNSPEFRKQIEEAQMRSAAFTAMLNSPEYKKQMEERTKVFADMEAVQKARAEAMKDVTEKMNSPEYRHEMEDMQRRVSEATAKLNSPEFKEQMEKVQREMREMQEHRMDVMPGVK